jgi:hypothetical protein
VILRASDGRVVRATPGQLAVPTGAVPGDLDPDHQTHLEAQLLDVGTIVARDVDDPDLAVPLDDARLGQITFSPREGVQAHGVASPLGPISVVFHTMGHERVRAVLPAVHQVVDALPDWLRKAVEFLWQWGASPTDTATGHEDFVDNFGVRAVHVYHSGAFGIELSDDRTTFAESFLDGYWPAVHFLPDGAPVFVTIEC